MTEMVSAVQVNFRILAGQCQNRSPASSVEWGADEPPETHTFKEACFGKADTMEGRSEGWKETTLETDFRPQLNQP